MAPFGTRLLLSPILFPLSTVIEILCQISLNDKGYLFPCRTRNPEGRCTSEIADFAAQLGNHYSCSSLFPCLEMNWHLVPFRVKTTTCSYSSDRILFFFFSFSCSLGNIKDFLEVRSLSSATTFSVRLLLSHMPNSE